MRHLGCLAATVFLVSASVIAAKPYAGIGGMGCDQFLEARGFEGDTLKQAEITQWVSGLATGINLGRQLSGEEPISLEPGQEIDLIETMLENCRVNNAGTISGAAIMIMMPIFEDIAKERSK
ncbi:hypothetical protein Q5Y75_01140 [Ruegeria sp. 2205SS24-7]|uniref:hypothetical protein n=1 Tax=Ruegeria discodermiae TaxID=3064389 RepID=UPI0027423809|nr:hypothetical protein [Ruegeria sp. 2205SS24-7]MDP5215812.1 hypothetical protein [Ruegeria sp. 2205SS24-7]